MEDKQNVYDDNTFFNEYKSMRDTKINANELIEIPIMKSMLPDIKNKKILDLGCGDGSMSKYFIENGAEFVLALDISENMIQEAKEKNNHPNIIYKVMAMEDIDTINEQFDLIFSSLAFHYIEDFNDLTKKINNLLSKNGILLFSQEHPLATATILEKDVDKKIVIKNKQYFLLSDYNDNSARNIFWNNTNVTKYHRNFSYTINTIIKNNFTIVQIEESTANEEAIRLVSKYKYQKDRPYFLFIKASKN